MIGSILSESMSARDSRRLTRKTLKSLCPSFQFTSRRSHSPLAIPVTNCKRLSTHCKGLIVEQLKTSSLSHVPCATQGRNHSMRALAHGRFAQSPSRRQIDNGLLLLLQFRASSLFQGFFEKSIVVVSGR